MAEENKIQNVPKIAIKVPESHAPIFSNSVQISVTNEEVALQFVYIRPSTSHGTMLSEVILTPQHAIKLQKALDDTIKKHFTKHIG